MAWCGWSDRLAPFVLAVYARAKPCCCWLYLACVPVLVYLVLSCMSAVVMHIVVVCLRINKVGYYYYYAAIFWINSILFSSRCGENRRNHDFDEKMNVISATRPSLAPVFTVFRYWGSQLLPPPPLQNFRFAPLRWNRGWLASIGRCGGEWFVGRQSVHMYYPFQSVSCAAFARNPRRFPVVRYSRQEVAWSARSVVGHVLYYIRPLGVTAVRRSAQCLLQLLCLSVRLAADYLKNNATYWLWQI